VRHEILWVSTVEDDDLDLVVGLEQIAQALQASCDLRIEEVMGWLSKVTRQYARLCRWTITGER
jgi:hypothetical protein